MISCLLIQVSRNPQGLPICRESVISGESIQVGRGAACKIHLLDHRVNLLHATMKRSEDGTLYIEGEKDATININGFIVQSAALSPGTRVEIGPYLLTVEPAPDGHDIALSTELTEPLPGQDAAKIYRAAPISLAALGVSKRKLGFALATGIFFIFLILPLLPAASSAFDKWQATLPVTLTESWNPGPLSGGHSVFGAKCSTCHQRAFQSVSDDACAGCHKQVAKHLAKDDSHARVFKNVRCTDCHLDHRGKAELVLHDPSACVTCHGDIKSKNASTALANVHDFGLDHPPFHITLLNGKNVIRARQDEKGRLVEKSGLKYSHQVHLDKKGVSSPQGDTVMVCKDCHEIDEAGTHFAPMTMQKTCQQSRCHELYFTEPVEGVAPHGSEREVMNRLREFYAKWLAGSPVENMAVCERVGKASGVGNSAKRALDCANDLARKNAAATLFREDGEALECVMCHEIGPTGDNDVPWKVAPLHINRDWQPGAVFSHSKHDTVNCTECHDKMNSKTSTEIAMPTIEKCRECHIGDHSAKGKIRSVCNSCHRFHQEVTRQIIAK